MLEVVDGSFVCTAIGRVHSEDKLTCHHTCTMLCTKAMEIILLSLLLTQTDHPAEASTDTVDLSSNWICPSKRPHR